jgi:hypothetical protein
MKFNIYDETKQFMYYNYYDNTIIIWCCRWTRVTKVTRPGE